MACANLSKGSKLCIGCSVCSALVVAIMIPVGIFVIGPNIAQSILDQTTVSLPNLTQAACPQNFTWLFNSAKINVPAIGPIKLSSTIVSYTQEVWTTACVQDGQIAPGALCGNNATEQQMGSYTSPEMTVSPGDNYNNFTVVMKSNSSLILSAWVVPLWLSGEKTRLILTAKDVKVKVLGLTFSGLTMRNEMTCRAGAKVTGSLAVPDSVCYPKDPKHDPYQAQEYAAICEAGALSLATTTAPPTTTTTVKATTATPKTAAIAAAIIA